MKYYLMVGILVWQTSLIAQGNFVYRNGAEVTSGINIDLNLDNTTDFTLTHPVTAIGNELFRSNRLTPSSNVDLFPDFAGQVMKYTSIPSEIIWAAGQLILPDPGPEAEWTNLHLNMDHFLAAVRIRSGEDWHYGWMRFEKVGEDTLGDLWGLRDAAYNSIPNASINMLQVPEPSTFVLMLSGAAVVLVLLQRKRRGACCHVHFL